MARPLDSLDIGSIVITKPKRAYERNMALGRDWAALAVVSTFHDEKGRSWAVGVPLVPGEGKSAITIDGTAGAGAQEVSHRMTPKPDHYTFIPLFEGLAPYKTRVGKNGETAEIGRLNDPFMARDLFQGACQAWREGVPASRVGMIDTTPPPAPFMDQQAVPAPPTPARPLSPRRAGPAVLAQPTAMAEPYTPPAPPASALSESSLSGTFDAMANAAHAHKRAERYGVAQAATIQRDIAPPAPADIRRVAAAYGMLDHAPRQSDTTRF